MENPVIIPCPGCTRRLRMPGDRLLKTQCPHCKRSFKVDHGRVVPAESSPLQTRRWLIAGMLLALIAGGTWYYTTIYEESSRYRTYEHQPTLANAERYLRGFGDSERAAPVRLFRDSLLLNTATEKVTANCDLGYCNCDRVLKDLKPTTFTSASSQRYQRLEEECRYRTLVQQPTMPNLTRYLENYGDNPAHADSVKIIRSRIIRKILARYNDRLPEPTALNKNQRFFRSAIDFVAATGNNVINVSFLQRTDLKDYTDYSAAAREATDKMVEVSNALEETRYPLPSVRPPSSIREFFSTSTEDLENGLISKLQEGMDTLFGERVLEVRRLPNGESSTGIYMEVDYLVSTLEEDLGPVGQVPSLYVWRNQDGPNFEDVSKEMAASIPKENLDALLASVFKGYLMATEIDWKLTMSFPGSARPYNYVLSTRPRPDIRDVEDDYEALRMMTATAFGNFSRLFLKELGVKRKTYW